MICSSRFCHRQHFTGTTRPVHSAYLETLVLQYPLDGCVLTVWSEFGLEHHPKGSIAHDLALCILHFPGLPSQAILYLLAYYLYDNVSLC